MAEDIIKQRLNEATPNVMTLKTDVDTDSSNPKQGGLTSGERATISRGMMPATAQGDAAKEQAAREAAERKGVQLSHTMGEGGDK